MIGRVVDVAGKVLVCVSIISWVDVAGGFVYRSVISGDLDLISQILVCIGTFAASAASSFYLCMLVIKK